MLRLLAYLRSHCTNSVCFAGRVSFKTGTNLFVHSFRAGVALLTVARQRLARIILATEDLAQHRVFNRSLASSISCAEHEFGSCISGLLVVTMGMLERRKPRVASRVQHY
eukprot:COSAG05_NODE_51_length_23916_cov_18.924931_6_plen_110_part_00